MAQAESSLITSRRNFLVRALGFTASGAALAVPIVTVADARERVRFHAGALEEACRDYYAGLDIVCKSQLSEPGAILRGSPSGVWLMVAQPPLGLPRRA